GTGEIEVLHASTIPELVRDRGSTRDRATSCRVRWLVVLLCVLCCRRDDGAPAPASGSAAAPRLIALTPSATEVVAALGAASLLVGVDEYSTYPPEVSK